ncbi:DUF4197 domain-containing protein [Putridiphycobacter roseus]|uniref:DUF4197 domain-containing protein n=1 Tax=Putridiphycobacter roseus TaxID=2219161 RepID=A0A2W1NQI9_9FLAO|nr:DUF4197 domain-containing protein [Putridiphycobacter roseus]PZE16918.1 DUF4197 domain-containing protein [Putridiphycobacter roseus]
MIIKKFPIVFGLATVMLFSQCDVLNEIASGVVNTEGGTTTSIPKLTNDEVISGLKEALTIGIQNGANLASMTDGFFKNDIIKLPFPEDAIAIRDKALELGLDTQVNKIELTLNRAAEEASKKAAPIFIDAIKGMSIGDGFAILKGGDNAATTYLKEKTTAKLVTAFEPVVKNAIETVKLTEYWNPVASKYNLYAKFAGKTEINPDLNQYVTNKGIDGLFYMVSQEEKKIRKDPTAQVTDLLKKVFGSVMN